MADSYPATDGDAKTRVAELKKYGYYAYYCCYEIHYAIYRYDSTTCCWVYVEALGKGKEEDAKAKVTDLMKQGPAYYFPFLAPVCVY